MTLTFIQETKSISGGSYAKTAVHKRFRKEVRHHGRRKLRDEIRYLCNLPENCRQYFPEVISHGEKEESLFMEQQFFEIPCLRDLLFNGYLNAGDALAILQQILSFVTEKLYLPYIRECSDNYLEQYHFLRVWHRIQHTLARAPIFSEIVNAEKIIVNGKEYWNIPSVLLYIQSCDQLRQVLAPKYVSPYIHGDLHTQNILINRDSWDFKLVDPRGYDVCDIYYDFGKLDHSFHGKYDFIHENHFSLSWRLEDGVVVSEFHIHNSEPLMIYEQIHNELQRYYFAITDDKNCSLKSAFNEVMHFSSDMPFHLQDNGREEKSIAIYLTGVRLINEFVENWGGSFSGDKWTRKAHRQMETWTKTFWH
jgi:serine/threonine protein kinase